MRKCINIIIRISKIIFIKIKFINREELKFLEDIYSLDSLHNLFMDEITFISMISKVKIPKEFPLLCKIDDEDIPSYIQKLIALGLFREKKVSLGKASQIAGLSVWEMMALLKEKKIPLNYSVEDFEKDMNLIEGT